MIYRRLFLIVLASKSLKLSFAYEIVYKNLSTTLESLNNNFKSTRLSFEVRQKFEAVRRRDTTYVKAAGH